MTEEKTNNQPSTPEGKVDEGLEKTEDYSGLSNEELEKLVKTGEVPKPAEPVGVAKPEEELPDDLKGKSAEELAKAYINIRRLHANQDKELGELRKFKEEAVNLDNQIKQYQIDATSRNLVETEIKAMSEEEKQKFYDDFSEDPTKALMPYISKAIKPIATILARQANEAEIKRLEDETKESRVPYNRKAVDKILASYTRADGRNELFDRYGTKAFQQAYDIYFKQNINQAIEKEKKEFIEKANREAEELAKKKLQIYTEPQGVTSVSPSGSTDYEHMSMEELEKLVGKPKD
ncbi:MAG TPA: hypothetical protein ENN27_00545 [Candidatus Atribacteria bacterium]|nr:hypothetical protein [Candidatus Atribacteria bacterium]